MATVIRLQRGGRKKRPFYSVVVMDSRNRRDGAFIEKLGYYDPCKEPEILELDLERVKSWTDQGAQVSDRVASLVTLAGDPDREAKAKAKVEAKEAAKKAAEEAKKKAEAEAAAKQKAEEEAAAKAAEEAAAAEAAAEEAPAEEAAAEETSAEEAAAEEPAAEATDSGEEKSDA